MERADAILEFWFGDGSDPAYERRWFAEDAAFDQTCKAGFSPITMRGGRRTR